MSGPIGSEWMTAEEVWRLYRELCAEQGISEVPDAELVRDVQAIVGARRDQ